MRLGEVMSSSPGLKKSQDIVVLFSGAPDSSHSRGTVGGKAHVHAAQAGSTGLTIGQVPGPGFRPLRGKPRPSEDLSNEIVQICS